MFRIDFIGRSNLYSHYCRCSACNRLVKADTYETRQFVRLFRMPFIPLARYQILDECPACGHRGKVHLRKFNKERKRNLAQMMDGFMGNANDPEICSNALRTLMTYNMQSWFNDIHESYGERFEDHPQVQFLIASGFCRFGNYEHAIDHARIAVVLGAGKQAEELLEWCQKLKEVQESNPAREAQERSTEPTWPAYIPIASLAAGLLVVIALQGVSAMRTYQAWLVNGSLEPYSFQLDGENYRMEPGSQRHVRLKLGQHELQFNDHQPIHFEYSIPFAKQLFEKNLLIINPDAQALFVIQKETESGPQEILSHGRQIHNLSGVGYPLFGFKKQESEDGHNHGVELYRPPTHMAMAQRLQEMGLATDAVLYARRTLAMNPATPEVDPLLEIALSDFTPDQKITFLRKGLSTVPAVMPWHLRYQDLVMLEQPDHDLVREYTTLCTDHPDQPAHYYLLGRVMKDARNAYKFFEHSEKAGGMKGLGFYSIADDLTARGHFEEALPYVKKACEADPENPSFDILREDILLALEKYEELLEVRSTPSSRIRNLTFAGYHMEAEEAIARFCEEQADLQPHLNAARYYAVGNVHDYHTCLADAGDPHVELEKLLHANRITAAHRMFTEDTAHPWWEHLVLYYAAMLQQETEIGAYHLEHALDDLDRNNLAYRSTADLLAAAQAPDADSIRRLHIGAHEKALLCMALSCRYPEHSDTYRQLARQYNYRPEYPQLLLKKWLRNR